MLVRFFIILIHRNKYSIDPTSVILYKVKNYRDKKMAITNFSTQRFGVLQFI